MKKHFSVFRIFTLVFAFLWLIFAAAPFVFQVFTSFKTQGELLTGSLFQLPESLNFANYIEVLSGGIHIYFINSILVIAISLTLLLTFSSFAAYPLARMRFKFNRLIYSAIVAAMSIPIHITLIPVFVMSVKSGIYDSIFALIGPNVAFNLQISIFILTGFMMSISREMEESAEIDGCGWFSTFFKIILPLSKPGIATLAIYNGVVIWNEFVFAMTLTQSIKSYTLPLAVWQFQGQYSINIPLIMTLLLLSSFPIILFYIIGQDKLIKGMMAGAIKG